ncbi:MAG: DUF1559 domain-containing protein [Planctomycetia bacterium]
MKRRRGFTLIEVIIVIGLIGLLLALILPAVSMAREAANRASCASNLKQFGVAINSYVAVHGFYPTPHMASSFSHGSFSSGNNCSAHAFLLPHLGYADVFDAVNFDFAVVEEPSHALALNATARNFRIGLFLCPSDSHPWALNNYRTNGQHMAPWNFPFHHFQPLRPAEVTRGVSNTGFVSERVAGSFDHQHPEPKIDLLQVLEATETPGEPDVNYHRIRCQTAVKTIWQTEIGRYWYFSGLQHTEYGHHAPPNASPPTCLSHANAGLVGAMSRHPGIVNLLYGDGRVAAESNSIDPQLWTRIGEAFD